MNWIALAWSGFLATAIATAFFWVARSFNWTKFSPPVMLGSALIRDPRLPITETLGFLLLLLLGSTVVPLVYASILALWAGPAWIGGVVVGGFAGLAMAAALPVYGTISASVRAGTIDPPGLFGLDWGRATPAIIFAGSMLYGGIFSAVYSGF